MAPPRPDRFVSLDVVRGMTIAGMVLVNSPGSWKHVYPPLLHADWHGFTFADLVFPSFVFIVGVAIGFALRRGERGAVPGAALVRIARRTVILFALGLFLNAGFGNFDLATVRVPGVLQRIAVCYCIGALLELYTARRTQALLCVGLLLGYWALLALVPVPGGVAGALDSKEGNLAAYVDRLLLPGPLYRDTYDPEGVLSTLPAIATTLSGMLAGHWLRSPRNARAKAAGLALAGAFGVALALAWSPILPLNKNLWTSSYVSLTSGISLVVLAATCWVVDVRGLRGWAHPFVVLGRNSIVVYVGASLVDQYLENWPVALAAGGYTTPKLWIWSNLFVPWAGLTNASLAYAVAYVLAWVGVAALLHRRGVFVTI